VQESDNPPVFSGHPGVKIFPVFEMGFIKAFHPFLFHGLPPLRFVKGGRDVDARE
jgi:hypothetical protein